MTIDYRDIQKGTMAQMAQPVVPMIGWNPPLPDGTPSLSIRNEVGGQRLLSLVRSLENKAESVENLETVRRQFEETVQILNNLIAFYTRRGNFLSDPETTQRSSMTRDTRKRGNAKQSTSSALKLHQGDDDPDFDCTSNTVQQSEALICAAMVRIFNGVCTSNMGRKLYLIELCAELCTAISKGSQSTPSPTAENDLLTKFGKPMLTGLVANIKALDMELSNKVGLNSSNKTGTATHFSWLAGPLDEQKHCGPLIACLKAASSVIGLLGTKFSRSAGLLSDLQNLAWHLITIPHDAVQRSAATVLATIPLAGGTERRSPSELWNLAFNDVIMSLSIMLSSLAPLNNSRTNNASKLERKCSEPTKKRVQDWIDHIRSQLPNEASRVIALHRCIGGLTHCFRALLSQIALEPRTRQVLLGARLDVVQVLDLVESFLSFPLSAESLYHRTKKRLRNETIGDGLLCPTSCAVEMAGRIKDFGHTLLDSTVSAIGGPALLPYARRIIRISYAALLTSSSSPVRKVLDSRHAVNLDNKKRRWLHTSVFLRTMAIRSFKLVTVAFGSDRSGKASSVQASSSKALESSDGDRTVALIAGCLVEQFSWTSSGVDVDDDWGSLGERVDLVKTATETLTAFLISCGGFASPSMRSLVDSIAMTGLSSMGLSSRNGVACWSSVMVAIFGLASACLTTPYPDGAASSIVDELARTARSCQAAGDCTVAMAAKTALRLCDSFAVPRAPALLFVTRQTSTHERSSLHTDASASAMSLNIQNARSEITKSQVVNQDLKPNSSKRQAKGKPQTATKSDTEKSIEASPRKKSKTVVNDELATATISSPTGTSPHREPAMEDGNANVSSVVLEKEKDKAVRSIAMSDDEPPSKDSDEEAVRSPVENVANNEDESDVDDDFPDIVDGGPDSDDE